jgi:hypothetical protein
MCVCVQTGMQQARRMNHCVEHKKFEIFEALRLSCV